MNVHEALSELVKPLKGKTQFGRITRLINGAIQEYDEANAEISRLHLLISAERRELSRMRWERSKQNRLLDEYLLAVEQLREDARNGVTVVDHVVAELNARTALLDFAREKAKIMP